MLRVVRELLREGRLFFVTLIAMQITTAAVDLKETALDSRAARSCGLGKRFPNAGTSISNRSAGGRVSLTDVAEVIFQLRGGEKILTVFEDEVKQGNHVDAHCCVGGQAASHAILPLPIDDILAPTTENNECCVERCSLLNSQCALERIRDGS
jgi:hypothetical protein